MGLETGNYIDALVSTNPTSSDNVSVGDQHFQLIKKVLKQSFPSIDQATNVIHASATAPSTIVADGARKGSQGLLWYDTTNSLLKFNKSTTSTADWVTIAISPTTDNSVDVNAGTVDGAVIGGSSAAAITGTTVVANTSVNIASDGATVTGIKDEDDMASDSAVKLATQQSIKAYVDTQLTAEDLDITTDSGTIDIDLDSETLTVAGGSGLDTSASSTTVTVNVTDGGVTNAKLADMAANTVKVRDANSSGVPSDVALATTEILIGDGTGFTAAALSGDATMTNAGAVTVAKIQGEAVSSTSAANDQYLKYSTASSEWQKVDVLSPDRLTTKGDLLVYNTVDSETRLPVGTNDYVLAADSSATNGVDWQQLATAGIADNAVTLGKLEDGTQGDILYYGASGAPARLGFGTSGYFLKTQGTGADPVWAASTVADDSITTVKIQDDAVTADKLADSINTEITANTAKVTNATHTGDVTGATALTIASGAVDLAMLSATGTADATTFLRGDNAWAAATTDARYVYAYLETSHQAVSSGVDTLVQLNGATQSHSAYNTGTYTWTATADDAGIWVFIAQCSVHYDSSNGDESKTYIYLNDVKSSGAYAWTWTGGTDYLRHYTFSQQYLVSISTSDTIKMYASLTAPSGTINLFSGDVASGPKANSLLGFKL